MKFSERQRFILFNLICIPIRVALVLIIFFFPYPELAVLTGAISLGFLYKYFNPTKIGFFGGKVFWSRAFHFFTFLLATIFLAVEELRKYAYIILAIDVGVSFLYYHIKKETFLKS